MKQNATSRPPPLPDPSSCQRLRISTLPLAAPKLVLRWRGRGVEFARTSWSDSCYTCEDLAIELVYVRSDGKWMACWTGEQEGKHSGVRGSTAQSALAYLEAALDRLHL